MTAPTQVRTKFATLANPADRLAIERRVLNLRPDACAQWGTMNASQAICHLSDSYRYALGEKDISPIRFPIPRRLARWLVLYTRLPWPKGAPTRPEITQGPAGKGTPPSGNFAQDRAALLTLQDRFCVPDSNRPHHPFFGPFSEADWLRHGYLHMDHHLRQFGV